MRALIQMAVMLLAVMVIAYIAAGFNASGLAYVFPDGVAFTCLLVVACAFGFLGYGRGLPLALRIGFGASASNREDCHAAARCLRSCRSTVWAFGVLFVIIQVVMVLRNLSDLNSFGPSIALMLSSLYGAGLIAEVFFNTLRAQCERQASELADASE